MAEQVPWWRERSSVMSVMGMLIGAAMVFSGQSGLYELGLLMLGGGGMGVGQRATQAVGRRNAPFVLALALPLAVVLGGCSTPESIWSARAEEQSAAAAISEIAATLAGKVHPPEHKEAILSGLERAAVRYQEAGNLVDLWLAARGLGSEAQENAFLGTVLESIRLARAADPGANDARP